MAVEDDPEPGVPEWVVTYGDMMSLLLTFFIMLVSMSEIRDSGKMRAMLNAIKERFGEVEDTSSIPGKSLQTTSILDKLSSLGSSSQGNTKRSSRNEKGGGGSYSPVRRIRDGTTVTLGGPVMFGPFDADLSEELKKDLDILAESLRSRMKRIEIRGHASPEPLPVNSQYRDQLDLSFARADNVAAYLISKGILRERILVGAAGDTEPRNLKRAKKAQALNRRVDVFLTDSYIVPSSTH